MIRNYYVLKKRAGDIKDERNNKKSYNFKEQIYKLYGMYGWQGNISSMGSISLIRKIKRIISNSTRKNHYEKVFIVKRGIVPDALCFYEHIRSR
jgi:hypothetical protein